jgi:hypothetical protein
MRSARATGERSGPSPLRNVDSSAAIMGGDPKPMREMLDAYVIDGT